MIDPNLYGDGSAPRTCYRGEEHDIELFEMNKRDGYDVWMCMICGLAMKMPRDVQPSEAEAAS